MRPAPPWSQNLAHLRPAHHYFLAEMGPSGLLRVKGDIRRHFMVLPLTRRSPEGSLADKNSMNFPARTRDRITEAVGR